MTISAKLTLNVAYHDWGDKENIQSRSPEAVLNGMSFTFLYY